MTYIFAILATFAIVFLIYKVFRELDTYVDIGFDCIERRNGNYMVNKCVEVENGQYSSLIKCQKNCYGSRKISLGLEPDYLYARVFRHKDKPKKKKT